MTPPSMAFVHPPSPSTLLFLSDPHSLSSRTLTILPKLPLKIAIYPNRTLARSTPKSAQATEQTILQAVLESDGRSLPAVRTFENDLARLTVVGAVNFEQALTAAAVDGGVVADEYLSSGKPAMIVETMLPGRPDERSTVSTRLFLPTRKVKEKAKKLKTSLPKDIPSGTKSRNILAMTFRQVVLEQLWNFELLLFSPGTERNTEEFENAREVPASFTIRSSDQLIISLLGEVVCLAALESTERHFLSKSMGRAPSNFFRRFQKSERVSSRDSSVTMCRLLEDEISTVANNLLENFNSAKASYKLSQTKSEYSWWPLSTYSKLEKIGGPEFGRWVSEYVPAYLFQINSDRLPDLKLEGWKRSAENRWEVLLTHNQMVALANILDMYYEDSYTLPSKQLSCGAVAKPINMYTNKLDAFCFSIVERIKVAFGWAGDIIAEKGVGAWIGELPVFLRGDADSNSGETPSCSVPIKENDEELKGSTQDIASYQVVLSDEGKIVGVQPTSLVAVNNWASNPLAKELYGGRKLSPGLIEPDLTIRRPSNVVVIEVLMSLNPDSRFALARPSK